MQQENGSRAWSDYDGKPNPWGGRALVLWCVCYSGIRVWQVWVARIYEWCDVYGVREG